MHHNFIITKTKDYPKRAYIAWGEHYKQLEWLVCTSHIKILVTEKLINGEIEPYAFKEMTIPTKYMQHK